MPRLMGVRDVMTFVQKGTENKEKMITNNRDKDKDKDKVRALRLFLRVQWLAESQGPQGM